MSMYKCLSIPSRKTVCFLEQIMSMVKYPNIFSPQMATIVYLVYTTQVNSSFRVRWLASSEVSSQVLLTSEQLKKNKITFVSILSQNKVTLWATSYSACVVYTKTIIHLSVGESGGYVPPLQRITIANYLLRTEITKSHLNDHICLYCGMKTSTVTPSFSVLSISTDGRRKASATFSSKFK